MFISPVTATLKKVEASLLCGFTTNATPRTRWTRWTELCWMDGSSGSRWLGTGGRRTLTTAAAAEEEGGEGGRRGDKEATGAGAGAPPAVRSAEDAAGPAAGAALAPEADPDTLAPGPGPTPDQSPVLPRPPRRPRTSPTPVPDLDPDPHPNPSPGPEAAPLPPKEPPGRDPKARPSQQQRMEANPLRSHHPSHSFQATTSDVQHRIPAQALMSCCKRFLFCSQALVCFWTFCNKTAFFIHTCAVTLFSFLYCVYDSLLRKVSDLSCFYDDNRITHTTGLNFRDLSVTSAPSWSVLRSKQIVR